jgi:hypothetical protein
MDNVRSTRRATLRRMKACMFASVATMTALGVLFFACGGGQNPPPKTEGAQAASSGGTPAASGSGGSDTTAPTTTLAVGPAASGQKLDPTNADSAGAGGKDGGAKHHEHEPGRSPEDIRVLVNAHRDEARACYDNGLTAHPGLDGDLTIKYVIDPDGNVSEAVLDTTRSTILEPSVGACVAGVLKKLHFAKSGKGVETRGHYPFNFHPRNTPKVKDAGN